MECHIHINSSVLQIETRREGGVLDPKRRTTAVFNSLYNDVLSVCGRIADCIGERTCRYIQAGG